MDSFAEVIDELGIAAVATAIGVAESHVRTMKTRDSIPSTYFGKIVTSQAGIAAAITYEHLHRLQEERAKRRALSPRKRKAA